VLIGKPERGDTGGRNAKHAACASVTCILAFQPLITPLSLVEGSVQTGLGGPGSSEAAHLACWIQDTLVNRRFLSVA